MEKVYVEIKGKRTLEGKLISSKNLDAGIIITHSWRNDINEPVCSEAAEYFAENGYGTLSVNLTGHGKSDGKLRDVSYFNVAQDINNSAKFMKKELGYKKLGAYGISLGAGAIAFSGFDFDARVLLSPRVIYDPSALYRRYEKEIEKQWEKLINKGYVKINSKSGRGNFEIGKEWIGQMQFEDAHGFSNLFSKNKIPYLIIQGLKDELLDEKKFKEFVLMESIFKKKCKFFNLQEADHNFTNKKHRKEILDYSLNFFNKHLI